jgi:CHC2-type zinc finger protein
LSAQTRGTEHPEWDAYVREVRDCAATREVEFIGRFTELAPAGNGMFKGLSPFRTEKTPSFYVYDGGRGCHDFGSGQGGDLIAFVRQRDPTLTFRQAIDFLARELGLDDWDTRKQKRGAPAIDPDALAAHIEEMSHAERLFACMTWLLHLCVEATPSSIFAYLHHHYGYSLPFIDKQKIGWCPDALWELAHTPGEPRPFTDEELLATGWFFPHGEGATATLGGRIVFPYWKNGQVRYAIGREHFGRARRADVLPEWYAEHAWDSGKYKKLPIHSEKHPTVSLCVRNDVLWGEDTLRMLRADGVLCIAEGVTDAGILAMLGFPVLSPVTVNFRNDDVERVLALLKHYRVKRIVILNDNDTTPDGKHPGVDGAKRMASGLWKAGLLVSIARLLRPDGASKVDINEIAAAAVAEGGEDHARLVVQKIIDSAELYPEFLASELSPDTEAAALEPVLEELGALSATMTPIAGADLLEKILRRFRKLPKKPARSAFHSAQGRALAERKADGAVAGGGEPAGPATGAAEGGAPAAKKKPAPEMRGHVIVHPDGYYERESAAGLRERISNFRLIPIKRIVHERGGPAWHCVRVEGVDTGWDAEPGRTVLLAAEWPVKPVSWISGRNFLANFPHEDMAFSGADPDVQGILELQTAERGRVPTVRSTGVLGRHAMPDGTLRFVLPAGTLGADGQWMVEPDLLYLPDGGSNLQHRLPKKPADLARPETLALLRELFESLLLLHRETDMAAMASWNMAALFCPVLRAHLGAFPILNVFGTPGSGKTSIVQSILWPAFAGVTRGDLLSCTSSAFAYARDFSSANAIMIFIDEYRPSDMGPKATEQIHRSIRRLYIGDTETRGRADQDVNLYYLQIPLGLLGEKRVEGDQAIHERCIFVGMDPNWLGAHPERKALYYALAAKPLETLAPLLQAWSLGVDAAALLAKAEAMLPQMLRKLKRTELPERVKHNVTVLLFGALAIDACATFFGTSVADVSMIDTLDQVIGTIFSEDEHEGGGRATRVRDFFDELYCEGAVMANLGIIQEGKHYVWVDGMLRLWVAAMLAASAEWRRGQGQPPLVPGLGVVRRIARERLASGDTYIVATNKDTVLGDDRRARCIEVAPNKVPESLGAESYPAYKEKTWGKMDWAATAHARSGDKDKD